MPVVDVNGARLWYDEAGSGETVLLLHGGLGDSGLWEPVVPFLAERFRTIRTDLRFFGRSTGPAMPWSWHDDVIGVLDELGLIPAVDQLALDHGQLHGIAVEVSAVGFGLERLPPAIEAALYRIIQEALTNSAKHSGARTASVVLQRRREMVQAIV